MMKSKILLAVAIFVSLGVFAFLDAKTTTSDDSKQVAVDHALGTLRAFGSSEATYQMRNGRFANLKELVDEKYMGADQFAMKDATSAMLSNYKVSVVPSADGKHFQISMISETVCDGGLFMNDSYLIFKGVPLGGCSEPRN